MKQIEVLERNGKAVETRALIEDAKAALRLTYNIRGEVVRVAELAVVFGLTAQTIRKKLIAGDFVLPGCKIGASMVVKLNDLAAWQSQQSFLGENRPARVKTVSPDPANRIKQEALASLRIGTRES